MMLKFWVIVFFLVVQSTMGVPFIFPDDDYFKQTKPTPRYVAKYPRLQQSTPSTNFIRVNTEIFKSCMASCPTTAQYDPVCGTNRETYNNKSTLQCVQRCGVDVRMSRIGRCRPRGQFS